MTSVLFVSSNGTGMGHLTRCMAIARRLRDGLTPVIFTLSRAVQPVREQGLYAEHFPSKSATGLSGDQWQSRFAARLSNLLNEYEPAVVAFDGTYPYRSLRYVLETHPQHTWIWIRRPMWQPKLGGEQLAFSSLFDFVIEPGEFAAALDVGPTVALRKEVVCVEPIVFSDEEELLSREEAESRLNLTPGRTRVLIQLGEVPQLQRDFLMQACANQVLQAPGTEVAILESAISESLVLPPSVRKLAATYPIAHLYRAFDFVISAAGYNSYHELINFQIPAAFFPVPKPLDNQAARARYAAQAGVGLEIGLDTTRTVEILMDESERGQMRRKAQELSFTNGAGHAADVIARLALTPGAGRGKHGPRRRAAGTRSQDGKIELGTATVQELTEIDGVGPVTARKIVELRDARDGRWSIEDLGQVDGIGPATMETLRSRLRP